MNRLLQVGLSTVALALAAQGVALADDTSAAATFPLAVRDRPDVDPAGMLELGGNTLQINFSSGSVFKPFSIAPNLFYSIADNLAVGITEGAPFGGLCLAGTDNGCAHVYDDIGLQARYVAIPGGPMHVTVHGGLTFESFDAGWVGIPVGATLHFPINPQFDLLVDPTILFGITKRDEGNKDFLSVPVTLRYQATPNLNVFLDSTIAGIIDPPVGSFGDYWTGSLGVGATYAITNLLDVGAEFDFANIYGNGSSGDFRELVLRLAYRVGR